MARDTKGEDVALHCLVWVMAKAESNERKGGTHHTCGVAQWEREQKQEVGISLIQQTTFYQTAHVSGILE